MIRAISCLGALALVSFVTASAWSKPTEGNSAESKADKIFKKAVAAGELGDAAKRTRLLSEAIAADPEHKLAHWNSGQVFHNGKWKPLEAIERLVANDPRWAEYHQQRASTGDTAIGHADLARLCRRLGLELEEKWHWLNVLRHDAKNREALGGLKLRVYENTYATVEQISAHEAAQEQAEKDFDHFAEMLKQSIREAERSQGAVRNAAIGRIAQITDPTAIPAVFSVVLADVKNERRILAKLGEKNGEKFLRQLQLAAITSLSAMPDHDATLTLLDVALFGSDKQVRADAAHALKYRELTDFVPLLMQGLAAPIELSIAVNTLSNGKITVLADYYEEGPLAQRKHAMTTDYLTQHVRKDVTNFPGARGGLGRTRVANISGVWSNRARDIQNASAQIATTQDRVEQENAIRELNNSRINEVLAVVLEGEHNGDPVAWWNAWKDYNELYTPEILPSIETAERFDRTIQYVQEIGYGRTMSCFVAGTPVWTQSGPVPIEKIQLGDLVLSQDPHTGELNYRPVVDTTVRPPSEIVRLDINGETILTTKGHRLWVPGKGWKMAKFLNAGDLLVAIDGSLEIESAAKIEPAQAFNLEVGQFHTYFVGSNRILVHDNTCPQPTTNALPGIPKSPKRAAPPLALRN